MRRFDSAETLKGDDMPYKDKEVYKKYQTANAKKRREQHKVVTDAIKREAGCYFCQEREPICLDFHHINPKQKEFAIGTNKLCSTERLLAEVAKCIVVCANCHRKFHSGILSI